MAKKKTSLRKTVRKERHTREGITCSCGARVVAYSFHLSIDGLAGRGDIQVMYEETGPHKGIVHVGRFVSLEP